MANSKKQFELRKESLEAVWYAAVEAVSGANSVRTGLSDLKDFEPDQIIAVGKAASGMCLGAKSIHPQCPALVVTKYHHHDAKLDEYADVISLETAHPVPDENSIKAGQALIDCVENLTSDSQLLLLVSGGASALAEALPEGMSLSDLQQKTDAGLASGKTIGEMNALRKQTSEIKDGKLLSRFKGKRVEVLAISDVEGDSISVIGSGLGDCHRISSIGTSHIVAANHIARDRAQHKATELGLDVKANEETLYGDVFNLNSQLSAGIDQLETGIHIYGGEPTVILPDNPGSGGRNQSLALALSKALVGHSNISILVAGTDGTDGPTEAAGGLVDSETYSDVVQDYLDRADAGTYLKQHGALFVTGPTHTNVMDLLLIQVD